MNTQEKMTPAQVATECEMLAFQQSDGGDREAAMLFMTPCNTIRSLLRTLERLNDRVHSGYDFNADSDGMTLEVGELLGERDAIRSVSRRECHFAAELDVRWKKINPILRGAMDYESFSAGGKAMREVEEQYRKERLLRED